MNSGIKCELNKVLHVDKKWWYEKNGGFKHVFKKALYEMNINRYS